MTPQERSFYGSFLVAAGVAVGLGVVGIILMMVYGGWPASLYPTIIGYLGKLAIGGGVVMALVILFLGLGGPVKNFKASFRSASIETQGDDCA